MEWTLFNNSQQDTKEDIWILASNPWLLVCSHLTIRWGGTPCCRLVGGTLSGNMPGYSVVWCPRQHSHTSQLNIIEKGVKSHRRKEERVRRRRRRDLYSTTSPTPQHVYRPQSVMWCVTRTEPAWRIVVIRRGASRAEGTAKGSLLNQNHCRYQAVVTTRKVSCLWQARASTEVQWSEQMWEDTRIWTGLVTPYRIDLQNKWLGKTTTFKFMSF